METFVATGAGVGRWGKEGKRGEGGSKEGDKGKGEEGRGVREVEMGKEG